MAVEIQGKTGLTTGADGVLGDPFLGSQFQVMTSDWAPRYAEATRRGLIFSGCNQTAGAGIAITSLNTTATGLILINPLGSGKNLFLVDVVIAQSTAEATTTTPVITIAANAIPAAIGTNGYVLTTPLTISAGLIGSTSSSIAKLLSAATLPVAPIPVRTIWSEQSFGTVPATASPLPYVKDEVAGIIGLSPGCAISLSANNATTAICSFSWIELPQ